MAKIWANSRVSKRKENEAKLSRIATDLQSAVTCPFVTTMEGLFVDSQRQLRKCKSEISVRGKGDGIKSSAIEIEVDSWGSRLKLLVVVLLGLSTTGMVTWMAALSLILVLIDRFCKRRDPLSSSEVNEGFRAEKTEEVDGSKKEKNDGKVARKKILRALVKRFRGKKHVEKKEEGFVIAPLMKDDEGVAQKDYGCLRIHVGVRRKGAFVDVVFVFALVLAGLVGGRTFSFILTVGFFLLPVLLGRLRCTVWAPL